MDFRLRRQRRRAKRARWRIYVLWAAGFVLFLFLGTVAGTYAILYGLSAGKTEPGETRPEAREIKPGERINILILGVDAAADVGYRGYERTDTMILVSLDRDSGEVGILSIPRDTRVRIPGRSYEKVNHAHAYGGPRLAVRTVEEFLDVPVHYYVRVDFEGFVRIVDILGGVEMDVPRRMYYEDPYQGLVIDLQPGLQRLDGDKALQFVRYRGYSDADIGRVRAQQAFINALLTETFQLRTIWKVPALAQQLVRHVNTNMDVADILRLARWGMGVQKDTVRMGMIPGHDAWVREKDGDVSYWVPNEAETRRVVDLLVRGIDREANGQVTVEVQYWSGQAEIAGRVAAALREQGYRVVAVTDGVDAYPETTVLRPSWKQEDGKRVARAVARLAGLSRLYEQETVENEGADVVLVLGPDFPAELKN